MNDSLSDVVLSAYTQNSPNGTSFERPADEKDEALRDPCFDAYNKIGKTKAVYYRRFVGSER